MHYYNVDWTAVKMGTQWVSESPSQFFFVCFKKDICFFIIYLHVRPARKSSHSTSVRILIFFFFSYLFFNDKSFYSSSVYWHESHQ